MITSYSRFIKESKENNNPPNKDYSDTEPRYYNITNYRWEDGKLDCIGNVNLCYMDLKKIPFNFGKIYGNFRCYVNEFSDLENGPDVVTKNFDCSECKITSLVHGPKIVGGSYKCSGNKLTDLNGLPRKLDTLDCSNNELTSFEGIPEELFSLFCINNSGIKTIEDYPMCIIHNYISDQIYGFKTIQNIVSENSERFRPLLGNKIKFHQEIMRIKPELIKEYKNIQPPSRKSFI